MQPKPKLTPITDFSSGDDRVLFRGRRLDIETMGEPIAQFQYGDKYLLVLPDDPFEKALFMLVLVDGNLKAVKYHSAPDNQVEAVGPKIEVVSDNTVRLDWGVRGGWMIEILDSPQYSPLDAYRRMTQGWLPLFEYPLLLMRGFLKITKLRD